MRVLIFSDVHANGPALEAVLEAAADCDLRLCLGDLVGYGADPNAVCERARALSALVVRGNHDRACAALDGIASFNPIAAAAARWTHAELEPGVRDWLAQLPAGPLAWQDQQLVHGSPLGEDEYLLAPGQAAESFAATAAAVHWFGHTHVQGGFVESAGGVSALAPFPAPPRHPAGAAARLRIRLRPEERYLLNPGSVGQPRDGDWRAGFAILDWENRAVEFHRVPYDVQAAAAAIVRARLPPRLAERLARGR